jgi:hypothetical protein
VTPKNTRVTHYYDIVPHIPEEVSSIVRSVACVVAVKGVRLSVYS